MTDRRHDRTEQGEHQLADTNNKKTPHWGLDAAEGEENASYINEKN